MMSIMRLLKPGILRLICFALPLLMSPALALAEDDGPQFDARIQNFQKNVIVPDSSVSLTWLLLIFLAIICLAALFKNAKRTHLD